MPLTISESCSGSGDLEGVELSEVAEGGGGGGGGGGRDRDGSDTSGMGERTSEVPMAL